MWPATSTSTRALGASLVWRFGAFATEVASGYEPNGETVGTPDGPVHVFRDPSGNEVGLLRADRPGALETAYADPTDTNAVH